MAGEWGDVRTKLPPDHPALFGRLYGSPGPLRKEARLLWVQQRARLDMAASAGVVGSVTWNAGPFDLRPDLERALGLDPTPAIPIPRGSAYGTGATLHVQLWYPASIAQQGTLLVVTVWEAAHVYDVQRVESITAPEDITSDFFTGGPSVLLTFEPPGGPVRFWEVRMQFDQISGKLGDLDGLLEVEAAIY